MDDNNYMNNDNQSSGTPDNTDVFGQSSVSSSTALPFWSKKKRSA